ncbi:hypothetical protein RP20_CCG012992 [Aedes albopictus]|nr:hypothetical protein RP20_CCG012992 [Aedes albopictus]
MKHAMLLSLLALACTVSPALSYFPEEKGILELNPSNYVAAVRQFPYLMVEFYAPWCPYCQTFAPKYEDAALRLATTNSPAKLAKLDASRYATFAAQLKVQEYPTMYFYRQGHPLLYKGEMEIVPLVRWVQGVSRPGNTSKMPLVMDLNSQNFDSAVGTYPILLVEFYAPWCPHCQKFAPQYLNAATEMARINPNVKFAKVDATQEVQLAAQHDVQFYPTLKLFHNGGFKLYDGPREQTSLINWLLENV